VADQLQAFKLPETVVAVIDLAVWDLAGRVTGLPVHRLLAGARDRVKAYASSWHNLGVPEDYATHAAACQRRGYGAYKIHSHYHWGPATKQFALG
jgi:L-alanine-DL-glutamate epimerase-like enolase superfamily enzyme